MIAADAEITKNPKVVSRGLGEGQGGVVLHLESGQYHGLNGLGWVIWGLLDHAHTLPQVCAAVRAQLADSPSTLEQDVTQFLDDLSTRDLIVLVPAQDSPH